MLITKQDKILIKNVFTLEGYSAKSFLAMVEYRPYKSYGLLGQSTVVPAVEMMQCSHSW